MTDPTDPTLDPRVAYGSTCTWWGSIHEVGKTNPLGPERIQLPCCPHCKGMLYEARTLEEWYGWERDPEITRPFLDWLRTAGKCWRTMRAAQDAYAEERRTRPPEDTTTPGPWQR